MLTIMRGKDVRALESLRPIAEDVENDKYAFRGVGRPSDIYLSVINFTFLFHLPAAYMFSNPR
jgi:hypothetical protein